MATALSCVALIGGLALAPVGHAPRELPLLVGGHAHGAENIRALASLGVGNFIWIPKRGYGMGNTSWDATHDAMADVEACVDLGFHFMLSQRRGLGPDFKPGGPDYGGDTTPEIYDPHEIRAIARRSGDLFVGLHAEELDADFIQNGLRANSRSRTPKLYAFSDRAGGRRVFEGELKRIGRLSHAAGARYLPNLCVSLHHSGFRAGGDIVMAELLESLPNVELQLAMMRGASQQFAKSWGVWVSPWHKGQVPAEDKDLWPGPNSALGAGHDATRLKRCLYQSWASGARVLTVQETEPLLARDGRGGYRLAAWGRELKAFWDYVRARPAPVRPLTTTAVMIDKDCGWAPGHLHGDWIERPTVWGKLQPERSDMMLAAYLDALLPGFERTTGWWKEGGAEYPGYFAATPGGAFDVVASDIALERLKAYRAVVLMGDIAMTPRLLATLKSYARAGGIVHANVNQMRLREAFVQDEAFLGATIGQSRQWSDWSKSNLLMRRTSGADRIVRKQPVGSLRQIEWREPWFVVQDVQRGVAEVMATTGSGEPVLLRHTVGKGQVWLSTPDFLLSGSGTVADRLGFFRDLLIDVASAGSVVIVAQTGGVPSDVSWVSARQGDDVVIVVCNHSREERALETRYEGRSARLSVGPEDVAVVRMGR